MRQPSPRQREALGIVTARQYYPDLVSEPDGWHARWRVIGGADEVVTEWVDSIVRTAAMTPLTADAENHPHATLHDAWITALRSRTGLVQWGDAECADFAAALRAWHRDGADERAARSGLNFSFDAAMSAVSCQRPKGMEAYRALGQSVEAFGPLRGLHPVPGGILSVTLSLSDAETFLRVGSRRLKEMGYGVSGVDLEADVSVSATVTPSDENGSGKSADTSHVELVVRVAGQPVTAREIRFLLDQGSSLVFFREHWIEVDRNILREALRALERAGAMRLSRSEALAFASGIGRIGRFELEEVAAHGWLRGMLNGMREARATALPRIPKSFSGTLRGYQKRGVAWMTFLIANGFGPLLADDMGLGKTVQAIAWMVADLAAARKRGSVVAPVLVVAPLTLLANWSHELATFAPSLRTYVHQGHERLAGSGFRRLAEDVDVVITSYTLLVRDHLLFGEIAWHAMILDEAQAIKNPSTAVARAVRALTPPRRIALTGTPVENAASDIWSIEEFLNPGFLGERRDFAERFAKPLSANPHAAVGERLRRALEPFVLRRLKSDPEISAELGAKREIREFCTLGRAERTAYEDALALYRSTERTRGDVFALLTRLKLVCDGTCKFERLAELLDQVFATGEKALVFTQYAKVGIMLRTELEKRFARNVPFLHGALTAAQREREISSFRSSAIPTAFVLSLRVGGFGLNLTEATHVFHYDRWWNPAVENQATDRAHRIGQIKTVFVHKMITSGTVEEHIDDILSRKITLSGGVVTSGESFLSQLPGDVFEKVVALDE